jgi:ATP-binding cassette, subfamily F, member 3
MLLQPFNLLLLDEPTNHLDMRSKDILKNALLAFDGTLIVVSHDRDFLDGLVDKVYEFRNHKVWEHLGGIFEFLQRRKLSSLREIERKNKPAVRVPKKSGDPVRPAEKVKEEKTVTDGNGNKYRYKEKKEQERAIRRISGRLKALEEEIGKLESELARMDEMLVNPENITGMQVYEDYQKMKNRHDEALVEWEKQSILLEKASAKRN